MVADRVPDYLSEEEYLTLEEASDVKHEYIDGMIYAMAGATDAHVTISLNMAASLRSHLRGSGCRAYMADMKVKVARRRRFFYPDVMVTCDGRDRDQINHKSHPCLIIEVLSDSTEAFDRGDKFTAYQSIETLQEYVLINAKRPRVDCFRRNEEGLWVLRSYELGSKLELTSVDLSISLDDIYEDVGFRSAISVEEMA
jgi:Uma2 family endonuclease